MSEKHLKSNLRVGLYKTSGIGFVIPYPSGIEYYNVAGGLLCAQPSMEGFFLPFEGKQTTKLAQEILNYFLGPPWSGHCYSGLKESDADYLDSLFEKYEDTKSIRLNVDRSKLKDSMEAWIHVKFELGSHKDLICGIDVNGGILTCPNSD